MEIVELTADQAAALKNIVAWIDSGSLPYYVVGGYAGTGKTTLIAFLRHELSERKGWKDKKVSFCSFTGKATSVLRQKLKDNKALLKQDSCSTIHSLIYTPVIDDAGQIIAWDRSSELETDLIIIDEGSMVNGIIWNDLRSFGKPILVFGDHGQLPPVDGQFYLMQGPHMVLQTIVRQAADNPIIQLSKKIREGEDIPFGKFGSTVMKYSLQETEGWDAFEGAVEKPVDEWLCICGTNRTRINLNRRIRQMKDFESTDPQTGDRVICLKNNHAKAIYNGMVGTLQSIDPDEQHWYQVRVAFDEATEYEGRILRYQFNQPQTLKTGSATPVPIPEREYGDLFDFGYALTCHKAQGSEADRVILFEERMRMYDGDMWRRWLYTAVTRAREQLVILA